MSSYEATKPSHDLEESSNTSSDAAANQSDAIGVTPFNVGNYPFISAIHIPNNINYIFYYGTGGRQIHYLKGMGDSPNYTERTVQVNNKIIVGSNRPLVAVQTEVSEIRLYYVFDHDIHELILNISNDTWSESNSAIPTGSIWDVSPTSGLWAVAGKDVFPSSTPARLFFVSSRFPGRITTAYRSVSGWAAFVLGPSL